jgi:pilus assembly protein CpaB
MTANVATQLPRRNNRRAFIIAALFGVLAAVLSLAYLRSANSGNQGASITTVPAIVAVRDIPERTVIKEGMIDVKQVPVDARHNLALTEKQAAVGQLTRVPIAAGEQVLRNKVADQVRDVGFSANIPQGKRGVAVAVTEVVATGGHIGVGDFVDVIGVFEIHDPNAKNTAASGQSEKPKPYVAVTILQNIQVLAVAQQSEPTIESTSSKNNDRDKVKVSRDLKSVTLALTPEQAEKLFLAEEVGTLRLSLRPFGEDEQRKIAPVSNDLPSIVG